ncbi:MAG: hypothetical protein J6B63_01030 [Treponema sp.]|nr:hypothetical protein [Treponema sp.]
MEEKIKNETLLIEDVYEPTLTLEEAENLKPIIKDFLQAYVQNNDKLVNEWLPAKLQETLPTYNSEQINIISNELINSLKFSEDSALNLKNAKKNGLSRDAWLEKKVLESTSAMSTQEASQYLVDLDVALSKANESLYKTITTNSGLINQNPHLDGFIAEQYHAQTFNLHAEANGSIYRAKVLEPKPGKRFGKNSVDIVIIDTTTGNQVHKYQSKYCKDPISTIKAFLKGDYRGQQKLVPKGYEDSIDSNCTTVLKAPDGTTSDPLSKEEAELLRENAQSGNSIEMDWNKFTPKELAQGVAKQVGYASIQGAAISLGFDVAKKIWDGEKIEIEDEVELALNSATDFGLKAATGAALKVGAERGVLKFIPKGTSAGLLANIAFVGIENIKVAKKVFKKELTPREGLVAMGDVTASTVGGLFMMGKGAAIGAKVGTVLGSAGIAVGSFIGGSIGYVAGSKVGKAIKEGIKTVKDYAVQEVKKIGPAIKDGFNKLVGGVKKIGKGIINFTKNLIS